VTRRIDMTRKGNVEIDGVPAPEANVEIHRDFARPTVVLLNGIELDDVDVYLEGHLRASVRPTG
jgi:2-methylaconitate cis-trans-isomerase PrpF